MTPPPRRILIIKPSSLGDVATALPLAMDLHAAFPEAQIDWLIHPGLRDLLRGHPALHEASDFDRKGLAAWWHHPRVAGALLTLIRHLRAARYDCVIDAQGLLRSGLLARLTGARIRIGFANAREGAAFCYTHRVVLRNQPQVSVLRMRALLEPLGIQPTGVARAGLRSAERSGTQWPTPPEVAGFTTTPNGYVVVIPGARWDTKRWATEGFVSIVQRLTDAGQRVVLAGSKDEAALCAAIAQECQRPVRNVAGQTSLGEMIGLLAGARLVVGNDSGPLHVAVALERPVVGVYGPTNPNFVGPYGQLDHVVRFAVECHPCRLKTCGHHSCMQEVTVEMVWSKIQEVLAGGS